MNLKTQSGATLITALVMLIVLTLLVISAAKSSTTNLRIAGNMQAQEESAAVAQQAIELIISSNFTLAPAVSTIPNVNDPTGFVDINNDTINDYQVTVTAPSCRGSTPIPNATLNMANPVDAPCISSSTASNTGIMFASGAANTQGQSWCFSQQWDVPAQVASINNNGVSVTAHQGVAMRVPAGTACP